MGFFPTYLFFIFCMHPSPQTYLTSNQNNNLMMRPEQTWLLTPKVADVGEMLHLCFPSHNPFTMVMIIMKIKIMIMIIMIMMIKWLPIGQYWRQWGCLWLIWKLMSSIFQNTCESCQNLKKFGCFTPPKSGDPESWYSKTLSFGHFFGENRYFDPFRQNGTDLYPWS